MYLVGFRKLHADLLVPHRYQIFFSFDFGTTKTFQKNLEKKGNNHHVQEFAKSMDLTDYSYGFRGKNHLQDGFWSQMVALRLLETGISGYLYRRTLLEAQW